MSSISSLGKMVSGLNAAQKGLQVTGQNISNVNTKGYTRQQLLQHDTGYLTIGTNAGYAMQVGLGVSCTEIRQIRDELADKRLRNESSILGYYQNMTSASQEIEALFDEPYGDTLSDMINDFWAQTQKLNTAPDGVEERLSFIKSAKVLIGKINDVSNGLSAYQTQVNKQVESSVSKVNELILQIKDYNEMIAKAEINGDNANDYRDQRNLLLDELSTYGKVDYYEEADSRLLVKFEGHIVINKKFTNTLELKQTEEGSPFNKPIWSDTKTDVYDMTKESNSANGNDTGSLKALLLVRGDNYVTADTSWDDVALNDNFSVDKSGNSYMIPKYQKLLNDFANKLVNMVNEAFDGTGIGFHEGQAGVPVFVLADVPSDLVKPAADASEEEWAAYNERYNALLIPGNIQVNPELLESGGYNKLGTVSGDPENAGDNTKITEFLAKWEENIEWYQNDGKTAPLSKTVNLTNFYSEFVTDMGTDSSLYRIKANEKNTSVLNIENERQAMGGVSQDEEFANMLKYQYAYNASARMITMLDGMLDTIINKL
nr:flagellar hook-associated protein FlgK [uncultured Cellulosilyticum sp.]